MSHPIVGNGQILLITCLLSGIVAEHDDLTVSSDNPSELCDNSPNLITLPLDIQKDIIARLINDLESMGEFSLSDAHEVTEPVLLSYFSIRFMNTPNQEDPKAYTRSSEVQRMCPT